MSNKKISFKNMDTLDKIKLINNSLVLDGISLKELSKKIDIQKKEIISFMDEEGFFFDDLDGYFKKRKKEYKDSLDNKIDESLDSKKQEREDVQSIIDSINEKLNIKDIETNCVLLPEIKKVEEHNTSKENNLNSSLTKTYESMTLEMPKISRTARRKFKKRAFFKQIILNLRSTLSNVIITKKDLSKTKHNDKFNIEKTKNIISKETSIGDSILNPEAKTNCNYIKDKNTLPFKIKIPKNFKGKKSFPKADCNLDKENILNFKKPYIEDFKDLNFNSNLIKNINPDPLENNKDKSLEERVFNLEKKVDELEEFFLEVFQAISNK